MVLVSHDTDFCLAKDVVGSGVPREEAPPDAPRFHKEENPKSVKII
jgi:hypothetical protein